MEFKKFLAPLFIICFIYGIQAAEPDTNDFFDDSDLILTSEQTTEELEKVAREAKERIEQIKSENRTTQETGTDAGAEENEAVAEYEKEKEIHKEVKETVLVTDHNEQYDQEKRDEYIAESELEYEKYYALIRIGKTLTFTGMAAFISGSLFAGIGFATAAMAVYHADLNGYLFNWGAWGNELNKIHVAHYAGATMFFWAAGALFLLASWIVIPGIIIWTSGAAKAGKLKKRKERSVAIHPGGTGFHLSVRF